MENDGHISCKICQTTSKYLFDGLILNKYKINYYYCENCGFLQTEEPYWLEEAYTNSISDKDTGLVQRNIVLSQQTSVLIFCYFNKYSKFLDFAGGIGLFTRLMRDVGFNYFWNDKYTKNLLSRGFEFKKEMDNFELISSFESFEHFENPISEIENMLKYSNNLLITTTLLPDIIPKLGDWWYYGLEHGQHISFYKIRTLKYLASKYNLYLYSKNNLHLITEKKINKILFKFLLNSKISIILFIIIKKLLANKSHSNIIHIKENS